MIIFLLQMVIACQHIPRSGDDTATITPPESSVSHLTSSATESRESAPATQENAVLLSRHEPISLETKEALIEWLLHVGRERKPTEVQRVLLNAGWIAKAEDWQQVDLDGDAQPEGVLTLIEQPTVEFDDTLPWSSVLIIDDELTTFEGFSERQALYRVLSCLRMISLVMS